MKRAERHTENVNRREEDIVCRVINGAKVKKRRYHKESEEKMGEGNIAESAK